MPRGKQPKRTIKRPQLNKFNVNSSDWQDPFGIQKTELHENLVNIVFSLIAIEVQEETKIEEWQSKEPINSIYQMLLGFSF